MTTARLRPQMMRLTDAAADRIPERKSRPADESILFVGRVQ